MVELLEARCVVLLLELEGVAALVAYTYAVCVDVINCTLLLDVVAATVARLNVARKSTMTPKDALDVRIERRC